MIHIFIFLLLSVGLAFGEGTREGVSFNEGTGISMGEETKQHIGLEIADVEERAVTADIRVTAQIYREARETSQNQGEPSGFAYASAWVESSIESLLPSNTVLKIDGHPEATGVVLRVDRTAAHSGGRAELLIQLRDDIHPWKIGEFVHVTPVNGSDEMVTIAPRSAILNTAYGPFAYVVNGKSFMRTPVEVGARHENSVEIKDGLYSGDQVVVRPVETLYLIELRATKGGGHSH